MKKELKDKKYLQDRMYQKFFTTSCDCGHVVKFKFMEKEQICNCCGRKHLSKRESFKLKLREAIENLKIKEELERGF